MLNLTDSEKAERLISMNGFGDKTPTQGLREMLKLMLDNEKENPGSLFRQLFLRQLPPDVQNFLAQTSHTGTTAADLKKLAAEADRYYRSTGSRVAAVYTSSGWQTESLDEDELGIDAISGRVLCKYHKKFGKAAKSCEKNRGKRCDWTANPPKKAENSNGRA